MKKFKKILTIIFGILCLLGLLSTLFAIPIHVLMGEESLIDNKIVAYMLSIGFIFFIFFLILFIILSFND